MSQVIAAVNAKYMKKSLPEVRSGDTVRIHQRIKEGNKERVQVYEGVVIKTSQKRSISYRITVRKIASGVGVERGFMLHAPNIEKVEVVKRSKVRRNYLSYLRTRTGKSARLQSQAFDAESVNVKDEAPVESEKTDTDDRAETPEAENPSKTE